MSALQATPRPLAPFAEHVALPWCAEPFAPIRDGHSHVSAEGVPVFSELPPHCAIRYVRNEAHAPYIRTGNAVVIDTADRELILDRLYLYQQTSNDHMWQISAVPSGWKIDCDEPCGMFHPLNRLRPREGQSYDDAIDELRKRNPSGKLPLFLSDGPMPLRHIQEDIIGRVVGVL